MTSILNIFVPGTPRPQARPRRGKYGNFYSPKPKDGWKEKIAWAVKLHAPKKPYEGPVRMILQFVFAGKKHKPFSPHTQKPDSDNLLKPVKDAMNGIIWKDDCQVYIVWIKKEWGEKAGVRIFVQFTEP